MMPFGWYVMIFLVALVFIGVAFKYGQKIGAEQMDEMWMVATNQPSKHSSLFKEGEICQGG